MRDNIRNRELAEKGIVGRVEAGPVGLVVHMSPQQFDAMMKRMPERSRVRQWEGSEDAQRILNGDMGSG